MGSKQALQKRLQRHSQRRERGQGMVEYALVLALVAVVAIVALSALGNATQRIYGVIGGVLGAKYNTTGDRAIEISTAQCIAVSDPDDPDNPDKNLTGLWVVGNTNIPVGELTGSTDQAVGTGLGSGTASVQANGPNGFKFNPLLAYSADLGVCPKAVVIQSADGSVAISPVTAVTMELP